MSTSGLSNELTTLLSTWQQRGMANVGTPQGSQDAAERLKSRWLDRVSNIDRGFPQNVWRLVAGGCDENGRPWKETQAIRTVSNQISKGRRFFILHGAPGTGKTVALSWIMTNPEFSWSHGGEIGCMVQARNVADQYNVVRPVLLKSILPVAIDDVGTEKSHQSPAIDELIQERYSGDGRTFLTTNLTPVEFGERYDERTVSRIAEVGAFIGVTEKVR